MNLSDLYSYMIQRLLLANMKNDTEILDEVSTLLLELRGAWESIRQTEPRPQVKTPLQTIEKTTLVYGRM
jgi:flagellar protein FliS